MSDGLWTQRQAAAYLGVSVSYLRASACEKVLLPGSGKRPLVRYRKADLDAFAALYATDRKAG